MSEEQIKERINDRLTIDANKLEGGFAQDIIGSVAYELANIEDVELNKIADRCFVMTAKGDDLDRVGSDYGISRRQATPAIVMLQIKGKQGAIINNLVKASYNNLVFTVQEYKVLTSDSSVIVKAMCDTLGTVGNVPKKLINGFVTQYEGLESVTNPESAFDGFDREDDKTYRERMLEYLSTDATNANKAQYHKWATEVEGVQRAVVKGAKDGAGTGNVKVYIASLTTVSDKLKKEVQEHINALQPINATVTVEALQGVTINISAKVKAKGGFTQEAIQDEFKGYLTAYFKTVTTLVSYLKISDLLFSCSGVDDVISYTLNGGSVSVPISDVQYPVMGVVNVNI